MIYYIMYFRWKLLFQYIVIVFCYSFQIILNVISISGIRLLYSFVFVACKCGQYTSYIHFVILVMRMFMLYFYVCLWFGCFRCFGFPDAITRWWRNILILYGILIWMRWVNLRSFIVRVINLIVYCCRYIVIFNNVYIVILHFVAIANSRALFTRI